MKRLEKFVGLLKFSGELLARLDRNFQNIAIETSPYAVTSTFTFTNDDTVDSLQVDASAGPITVYLPEQPNGNRRRRVIKTDVSVNAVTVDGNGNNINGAATYILAAQYDYLTVEPTGTSWLIVS